MNTLTHVDICDRETETWTNNVPLAEAFPDEDNRYDVEADLLQDNVSLFRSVVVIRHVEGSDAMRNAIVAQFAETLSGI